MSDVDREEMFARLRDPQLQGATLEELAIVCIGCGCTLLTPCPGGCFWAAANPETGQGICSRCVGFRSASLERRVIV